ncbi:hypothetical protein RvY_06070 [Ramazzottius varieornatus]|uniref:Major facilitator superfamily associated domain-containing protein n=1 Tax=Ramazzottius varieornatus TaxID=947166 RepID=A0A1D1UXR7_RAMVA|nr:hypothetical protein RvY_06070 [Ramazzottius varieornatus]
MSRNDKVANGWDEDGRQKPSLYMQDVDHTAPMVTTPDLKDDFDNPIWTRPAASAPVEGQGATDQADAAASRSMGARIKSTMRINPKLLPVKLLVFLIHGGVAAIFPFFTLHMKSLGISVKEMAVMLLLLPIVSSIGPPLGGWLADRLGSYKIVLIMFSLLGVILHILLWFAVPGFGTIVTHSSDFVPVNDSNFLVSFPCTSNPQSQPQAFIYQAPSRNPDRLLSNCSLLKPWSSTEMRYCKTDCPEQSAVIPTICFFDHNSIGYLTETGGQRCVNWRDMENFRVSQVTLNAKIANHTKNGKGNSTRVVRAAASGPDIKKPQGPTAVNTTWGPSLYSAPGFFEDMTEGRCVLQGAVTNKTTCSVTCGLSDSQNHLSCQEVVTTAYGDRLTTLALYFTFRFLSFTAIRVVFPLSDAAILEIAKEHKGDFGIQRLFASVGFVVVPPLSGYLIGLASRRNGYADYSPAFYIFAGMNIAATLLMVFMRITVRKPQTNIWGTMGKAVKNPNVFAFIVAIFFSGCAFGILINYLFLFMENDKDFVFPAQKWLLGLSQTVGYLLGIPLLFFSTQLIRAFGLENLLAFGLLCYAARFLSYSYIFNPFHVLPIEILTAVTGMVLVLMPQFALKTAPKHLGTLVGLFGAVNFGLGGGIGPLVGGMLVHSLGYRLSFQILSAICASVGVLYLTAYHLFLKTRNITLDLAENGPPNANSDLKTHDLAEKEPLSSSEAAKATEALDATGGPSAAGVSIIEPHIGEYATKEGPHQRVSQYPPRRSITML